MITLTRREYLWTLGAVALASRFTSLHAASPSSAKTLRGAFIILNTPFTATGEVDWDDLIREVEFVDRAGCHGIVWPQGSSSVTTLTKDERMHGMEVLAKAVTGKRVALVLGVQGKDIAEMREYATRADALNPDAVIAMPPTTGTSMDDYRAYFHALAAITKRPVFVQTSGGARDLPPTTDLIVELAKRVSELRLRERGKPAGDCAHEGGTSRAADDEGCVRCELRRGLALRTASWSRWGHHRQRHVRRRPCADLGRRTSTDVTTRPAMRSASFS